MFIWDTLDYIFVLFVDGQFPWGEVSTDLVNIH